MEKRVMLSLFREEGKFLRAIHRLRAMGYTILEAYTPYAVHHLDRALGLPRSRLPWLAFLLGLIGAGFKVWFEFWTTSVNWPLNVGGKPWNSLPAFVPVTFEVMVLFAGIGTTLGFLYIRKLYPGKKPRIIDRRVTDDHFALLIEETGAWFEPQEVERLLKECGAAEVKEFAQRGGLE